MWLMCELSICKNITMNPNIQLKYIENQNKNKNKILKSALKLNNDEFSQL